VRNAKEDCAQVAIEFIEHPRSMRPYRLEPPQYQPYQLLQHQQYLQQQQQVLLQQQQIQVQQQQQAHQQYQQSQRAWYAH
jgi:hypothetical protein